jgi:ABC-type multidrug transport system fused ATPase/permease subunit
MKNSSINNFLATLRFGRPYVGYLLLISLLNLLTIAADLGFLYLLKKLIDTGFATQSLTILKWLALGALGILLLRSASGYASGFLSNYVNGRMAADIQDSLYSKIQQLSMDFHTDISTGDLLTLVFYHTNAMLQIITSISGIMIKELFRIPALTVFLFSLHTRLALFALLVFPPSLLGLRLLRNVITRTTQNTHGVLSQLYETAEQTLSHTEIIKTFAKEAEEAKRFKDLNKEMVSRSIKAYQAAGL